MRLAASLALLATLAGCAAGAPALPQPSGPMIVWNTGMWATSSNATVPGAQAAPVPLAPVAPVPPPPARRSSYRTAASPAPAPTRWVPPAPVRPAAVAPTPAVPAAYAPPNLAEEMR